MMKSGIGLLDSDNILRGGQQMVKNKHVPNEDLEDMVTSSVAPGKAVAIKERHVVGNDVLPTNIASLFYNQHHVQSNENGAPAHCDVLLSRMDGVYAEVNASMLGMESIDTHDPPLAGVQEVVAHSVASALTRQLFKLSGNVPSIAVCIPPP
jgi:hypothetical protein